MIGAVAFAVAAAAVPNAEIARLAAELQPALVETRRDIHAHPELANWQHRTGKLVATRLQALGLEVRSRVAKTGVVGVLRGTRDDRVVAVRADMDALPIVERRDVPYRSRNVGVMHACGHDVHTAIVLGVAEVLSRLKNRLPGTVVFVFQPAEEGAPEGEEGGAVVMLREGALDNPRPQAILGLHVDPLLDVGLVGWSAGNVFASSDRFVIEVRGKRTHGAYPHTGVDPIPVAAEIVLALQGLVTRGTDAQKPKVLSIGTISGGEAPSILAGSVRMRGTLRSLDEDGRNDLKGRMVQLVEQMAAAHGAEGQVVFSEPSVPALSNDKELVTRLLPSLALAFGRDSLVEVEAQMGAEDFAFYTQGVPGLYLKLGVRNESKGLTAMVHTEDFDVDEASIEVGVRALSTLAWAALRR